MANDMRFRLFTKTQVLTTLSISVLLCLIGLLVVYQHGQSEGEEFSPDDFSRRAFQFNRTSYFPYTFQGLQHQNVTAGFIALMVNKGWIPPPADATAPKTWHLVRDNRLVADSTAYDAEILCHYLDMKDGNSLFWEKWNADHPLKAARLWPIIADMARSYRYELTPILLEFAITDASKRDSSVDQFNAELDHILLDLQTRFGYRPSSSPSGLPSVRSSPSSQ